MIHIIDEISFSKIACDLHRQVIDRFERSFNEGNYFRIGTTFLEYSRKENLMSTSSNEEKEEKSQVRCFHR